MKALVFERSLPRFAAARVAGSLLAGSGARVGPLSLADVDEPRVDEPGWVRVRPRLAGICGSDLATIDGRSSRYFEPIVSFPFVPGHEIVGELDDGSRVVVVPVLRCAARGIEPMCDMCAAGRVNLCERVAFGHIEPGLQTGFCADTGGGWGISLMAHESQLRPVPDDMSDEGAVMVEPAACAVHAARQIGVDDVAVIGSGTLGLLTIAAVRRIAQPRGPLIATAKHPEQRRLARELGADVVVAPDALERAVRSSTRSLQYGSQLSCGIGTVVDCVGREQSLAQALRVVAPGGTILLVGMPGPVAVDLTGLWHREVALRGCYAYDDSDFDAAFDLVQEAGLDRLVTATYPIDRYRDAIDHAAHAGGRGAVKVAFDLRSERERRR
ncbi:MAG: Alcohol dehydrogenase, zinc-binding domain protein [Acidimicrobiales bacterium]|nr:Alcohol dehydrogenase, zinc-binding domain protein [Acidimicrobiales bacterium]